MSVDDRPKAIQESRDIGAAMALEPRFEHFFRVGSPVEKGEVVDQYLDVDPCDILTTCFIDQAIRRFDRVNPRRPDGCDLLSHRLDD